MSVNDMLQAKAENDKAQGQAALNQDPNEIAMSDGSTVPLTELKDGYLRRKDYTQKTQELGEKQKGFDEQNKELEERRRFDEYVSMYFNQKPEERQKFEAHFQGGQQTAEPQKVESPTLPEGVKTPENGSGKKEEPQMQYVQDPILVERLKKIEQEHALGKVDAATATLKVKYSIDKKEDLEAIQKLASENWSPNQSVQDNLDKAYKIWHHDFAVDAGKKLGAEEIRDKLAASNLIGASPPQTEQEKSQQDLFRQFIADPGQNILANKVLQQDKK